MPIRSLLVPVDFSATSRFALATADAIAEQYAATLHLLYVHAIVEVPVMHFARKPAAASAQAARRALTEQLLAWCAELSTPADRRHIEVVVGSPVDEIIRRTRSVDLAVLGTHGRSGVGRFLLGSVAERVVQGAFCSVFVAKQAPATIQPDEG